MGSYRTSRSYALVLAIGVLVGTAAGCTQKNVSLGDQWIGRNRSDLNRTDASLGVPIQTLRAANPSGPVILPTSRPITHPVPFDRNGDGIFFGIAISGGGSRSANFAAPCMFELDRLGLLHRADYISAVSGGSLTAAYYCLSTADEWRADIVQRKLTHSYADDILWPMLMPWNWPFLTFSDWDRSDLLADSFQKHLFSRKGKGLTFGDLRADRPRLLINATDLQSGKPFVFCNESFEQINSDLSKYPIAHAVTASAAVPVLLHHITLRDYSTTFKQYVHLIDGGVTDNLGIRTLTDLYDAQRKAAKASGQPEPYPRGAVFIVLDARTEFDAKLSDKSDIGLIDTLATGAGLTSTVLINRVSSATLAEIIVEHSPDDVTAGTLRKQKADLERDGHLQLKDSGGHPVFVVHFALSRLSDLKDLPFASFHERVNSIETYFNISATEAYNLHQAAELLVSERYAEPLRKVAEWMDNPGAATTVPAKTAGN